MGNTNSVISVMFEEIKGLLEAIDKKLNEGATVKATPSPPPIVTETKSETDVSTIKPERLIRLIAIHLQESDRRIGQVSERIGGLENHLFSRIEDLKHVTINQKPDSKVRHYHIIEWRSNKVVIILVALSILFMASFIGNIHQLTTNSRMTDNDLKYRYIKSRTGINSEDLTKLEDIFHFHRDKKLIMELRENVENYERELKERAEKLIMKPLIN